MREECILVNENDEIIGHSSKLESHLLENIDKGNALHRAFSVFVFDQQGRLLLQKRASEKITFPDTWTNTCCSHPLYRKEEMEEGNNHLGVRRAACRKLEHELGISQNMISLDDLVFLTRIIYKAPSDTTWGEHEIDYILFAQKAAIPELENINQNEVSETRYVSSTELKNILQTRQMISRDGQTQEMVQLTPWFTMIAESGLLFQWWDALEEIMEKKALSDSEQAQNIFKMKLEN
eukprot:jgi/Bigna1/51258/estExt_Genewise1.C_1270009